MARFVLTPCHVRADRVVPSDAETVEVDWPDLVALLAPSKTLSALNTLMRLRPSAYVGVLRSPKATNFLFVNTDKGNEIGWLLKRQPDFPDRLDKIFRVEVALFDSRIEEYSSGEPA